jgi:hypothetical protein
VSGSAGPWIGLPSSPELARPFDVTHRFIRHPLLSLESLLALAKRLPPALVRYHSGKLAPSADFDTVHVDHATGMSLEETMRSIETAGSFVQINHIEQDAAYREIVDAVLDGVEKALAPVHGRLLDREGWIFVSSPWAVTPYHMDHHANFLLQVAGEKVVHVWDPADRSVVPEETLESFHAHYSLKDVKYRDEYAAKSHAAKVRPGVGVYMPYTAPHMVQNGGETSITLSVSFSTVRDHRSALVHIANHLLRRMGLAPSPGGRSEVKDRLKGRFAQTYLGLQKVVRRARGSATPEGYAQREG